MNRVISYLSIALLLPCRRTADVCKNLFGHRPSAGSVLRAVAGCAEKVAAAVESIAGILREAKQLIADESGVRCTGHTEWIHVVPTATHTLYNHSPKRGREAFDAGGVLPVYRGNLTTDFRGGYDTLDQCAHTRCNIHLLRELISFSADGQRWVEGPIATLLALKKAADDVRQ